MNDSADVLQFLVSSAEAIGKSGKFSAGDDWASLIPALRGLFAETVPILPKLHNALAEMDQSMKDQLLSQLSQRTAESKDLPPTVVLLILYLLIVAYDIHKETVYELGKEAIDVFDPPADYWFQRVDTAGNHCFFDEGLYLVNSIPPANTSSYFNSEIYNSPYTSIRPKNVIINTGLVDDPKTEPALFLYDLFLNLPYVAKNGTIFSARVKAQNLQGGSRGWGFWNTSMGLNSQIAWFIQFNGFEPDGKPYPLNGFWAQTQNGLQISMFPLPPLDEGWHDYRIEMTSESVNYYIDNRFLAQVTGGAIPSSPMAFHNWVDNAVFDIGKGGVEHVMQPTTEPRFNYTEFMRVYSGPINSSL